MEGNAAYFSSSSESNVIGGCLRQSFIPFIALNLPSIIQNISPASSEISPIVLVGKGHGLRSAEKWQFLLLFPHSDRA